MRRWLRVCALVWERARSEYSTPRETGWSIAVGVFAGCTPFLGLHMWIALALATLLRLNRLWAFLGSRVSFGPVLAGITFSEIEVAHRMRTGAWVPLSPHEAVAHGRELLGDWLLGAALVGGVLATALGFIAYVLAYRIQGTSKNLHSEAGSGGGSSLKIPPSSRLPVNPKTPAD